MTTTWPRAAGWPTGSSPPRTGVEPAGALDGDGLRAVGRRPRRRRPGRRRAGCATDAQAVRFVEVTVNGPKTWSLAAALRPGDRRRPTTPRRTGRASRSSAGSPSTRRPGWGRAAGRCRCRWSGSRPRWCGTTPPVPVTRTATCTSRSTPGSWPPASGVACTRSGSATPRGDQRHRPRRRDERPGVPGRARRARLHPRPESGEVAELAPYVGAFSARAAQIGRNIDRYEAEWRSRAPRPGARPAAAAVVGPAGLGGGPTRQGRPHRRRRAGRPVERGAARPRLPTTRPPHGQAPDAWSRATGR